MNADHADSIVAMVKHCVGIDVDSAKMLKIDRLGFEVECTVGDDTVPVRLQYPEPAEDRKAVKDRVVQMTKDAAAAAAQ